MAHDSVLGSAEHSRRARRRREVDLTFAAWLTHELQERGLSRRELGRLAGVHHSTLSRVLVGARTPNFATVQRICAVVGSPPARVVVGTLGWRPGGLAANLAPPPRHVPASGTPATITDDPPPHPPTTAETRLSRFGAIEHHP